MPATTLRILGLGLSFMLIVWSGLAIYTGQHFYGSTGIAYSWAMLALGIGILSANFGYIWFLKPPYLYLYVGFFALMFANELGWVSL